MSLLAIVELTLFFGESMLDMSVSLALTVLLIMYTFYQSISDLIPKTAYLKLMDYWLIFCLLVPFMIFINQSFWYLRQQENTEVEMLQRNRKGVKNMSKRKLIQLAIVGLTVAFIFGYFVVAVYIFNIK